MCECHSRSSWLFLVIWSHLQMHGYFKISTYCSSLTLAPVQKTFASASCHLSSAGHCDQNSGNRRAQVSQDHPSGLTPVTQAEHEQQNSLPLACSQPAASCNIPPLGNQTGSITHSITTVTCSKYIIEYLIYVLSLCFQIRFTHPLYLTVGWQHPHLYWALRDLDQFTMNLYVYWTIIHRANNEGCWSIKNESII